MNRITLVALLCFFLGACNSRAFRSAGPTNAGDARQLVIFAAASLTDPFEEMARAFEAANPGIQVVMNFAGSQQLVLQLEQGARADVLATADQRQMDRAVAAGLARENGPRPFAKNRVVVILPAANPAGIETLTDLSRPGVKLVLAGEQVPIGTYTRQVLENLSGGPTLGDDFGRRVLANTASHEESVKQVVAKVALGEADAGFVYSSDVTTTLSDDVQRLEIPDEFNVKGIYPITTLAEAAEPEPATQFVDFVLSTKGQEILQRWGLMGVGE